MKEDEARNRAKGKEEKGKRQREGSRADREEVFFYFRRKSKKGATKFCVCLFYEAMLSKNVGKYKNVYYVNSPSRCSCIPPTVVIVVVESLILPSLVVKCCC